MYETRTLSIHVPTSRKVKGGLHSMERRRLRHVRANEESLDGYKRGKNYNYWKKHVHPENRATPHVVYRGRRIVPVNKHLYADTLDPVINECSCPPHL